jgi:hypothetical protein
LIDLTDMAQKSQTQRGIHENTGLAPAARPLATRRQQGPKRSAQSDHQRAMQRKARFPINRRPIGRDQ